MTSAVWPMDNPATGSVKPFNKPITGVNAAGRNFAAAFNLPAAPRAPAQSANQFTNARLNNTGMRLIASAPPASVNPARLDAMFTAAESSACMPLAQLRATVHAGIASPQPRRSDTTRPMFASSTLGPTQPRITSSNASAANPCRANNACPAATAKSAAANAPGRPAAFKNGVRQPSIM